MRKKKIYTAFIAILLILFIPFGMLFGPARLRDYLHKELVYKVITDKVTAGARTDRERAFRLMDYVYLHVRINVPGFEVIDKHPLNDLFRNVGVCDQVANTLVTLARKAHIKGRLVFLRGDKNSSRHSLCDLCVNGKFRICDPTYNLVFMNKEKEIATFEDIQRGNVESRPFVLESGLAKFAAGPDAYFRMFEPAYPPKIFRTNFEQDKKRFVLSRMMDAYYDVFGEAFLILYQEAYFKLSGADIFTRARYKHLAFRFDSAASDYDEIIDTTDDNIEKSECMFFKSQICLDRGERHEAAFGLEAFLKDFPGSKRRLDILKYLASLYKMVGDLERSDYYLAVLRSPSKKLK